METTVNWFLPLISPLGIVQFSTMKFIICFPYPAGNFENRMIKAHHEENSISPEIQSLATFHAAITFKWFCLPAQRPITPQNGMILCLRFSPSNGHGTCHWHSHIGAALSGGSNSIPAKDVGRHAVFFLIMDIRLYGTFSHCLKDRRVRSWLPDLAEQSTWWSALSRHKSW